MDAREVQLHMLFDKRELEEMVAQAGSLHEIASRKSTLSARFLWTAAYLGFDDWVQPFIDCNFDLWVSDHQHGLAALHSACLGGCVKTVKALVDATGIALDREKVPKLKHELGSLAVLKGHTNVVKYLLDAHLVRARHSLSASQTGNVPMLKLLREVMDTVPMIYTLGLRVACRYGQLDAVKYLLDNGGDPSARDSKDRSTFELAVLSNNDGVIHELLKRTTESETPKLLAEKLMYAVKHNDVDLVKDLVALGAIAKGDMSDGTPLDAAARAGHTDICKILLDGGLSFESHADKALKRRIYESLQLYSLDVIKLFLQHGLDLKPEGLGMCPLNQLSANGSEFIQLLLDAGADPNGSNPGAYSPLTGTITGLNGPPWTDQLLSVRLLLEAGANPNGCRPQVEFESVAANLLPIFLRLLLVSAPCRPRNGELPTYEDCRDDPTAFALWRGSEWPRHGYIPSAPYALRPKPVLRRLDPNLALF
eukprot:TRINITY_DN11547_c0_g1_i3.p1 TRINITY_DN11547_c0_g1~~TRINITY_DN11547_c0_g1_i3.p1  ORF type:complete len:496 (+),score=53.12 TRINITY_DN11547_c0_g1_i3:49-1488(+)